MISRANCLFFLLAAMLVATSAPALAAKRNVVAVSPTRALSLDCITAAAQASDVPLAALMGILAAEGGRTGQALSNNNGTWDLGPFQLNTCHTNELASMGVSAEQVLRDGCMNAHAAAWLLRKEYNRTGEIWSAVGAYHSRTPSFRDAYIARVKGHLTRLNQKGLAGLLAPHTGRSEL